MEKKASRKDTRARVMEKRAAREAARVAAERANLQDLTEVAYRQAQLDDVDIWLSQQIERANLAAEQRREKHRIAIGGSLQSMRLRGETMRAIAEQAEMSERQIRELIKCAQIAADPGSTANNPNDQPQTHPQPVPTDASDNGTATTAVPAHPNTR